MLRMDGFNDCIAGVISGAGIEGDLICYDREKVIEKIAREKGLEYHEAREDFEFNQECAYVGPQTPVFLEPLPEED